MLNSEQNKYNLLEQDNITNKIYSMVILLLCLNIYTMNIDRISFMSTNTMFAFVGASLFIFIVNCRNYKFNKLQAIWVIGVSGMLLSCINSVAQETSIKYVINFSIAVILMIFLSFSVYAGIKSIKYHKIFSIVYMIFTLFELTYFNGYMNIMKRLFSSEKIDTINNLFQYSGRYVGIGLYGGANGFVLSLGFSVFIISLIGTKEKYNLIKYIIITAYVCSIFLTGSRTILLVSIFSLFFVIMVSDKAGLIKKVRLLTIVLMLVSIIGVLSITFIPEASIVFERFISGTQSIDSRFILYNYALQLFMQKPLLGQGIDTFLGLTSTNGAMIENTYVHNVFLQLLCETGIIGLILILTPVMSVWANTIKILRKNEFIAKNIRFEIPLKISLYVQTLFIMYFFTGNPLYDYNILIIYLIFCSIPIGCYTKYKQFNSVK